MPTLREIKGHINSVRSIAQVTRAMEVVALTKHHRLRERAEATRAFAERSWEVLIHLASAAESYIRESPVFHGYDRVRCLGVLLITSNKGMVGSYNHDVITPTSEYISARHLPVKLVTVGKIGRDAMLEQGYTVHADFQLPDTARINEITPVARVLLDGFNARLFEEVFIAYTQSRSSARSQPVMQPLLPIRSVAPAEAREYVYEPSPQELLMILLPRLIRFQIYQAFLESLVAENVSRMMAMNAATQNASELIRHLTISYNKARQQAITAEIVDIMTAIR